MNRLVLISIVLLHASGYGHAASATSSGHRAVTDSLLEVWAVLTLSENIAATALILPAMNYDQKKESSLETGDLFAGDFQRTLHMSLRFFAGIPVEKADILSRKNTVWTTCRDIAYDKARLKATTTKNFNSLIYATALYSMEAVMKRRSQIRKHLHETLKDDTENFLSLPESQRNFTFLLIHDYLNKALLSSGQNKIMPSLRNFLAQLSGLVKKQDFSIYQSSFSDVLPGIRREVTAFEKYIKKKYRWNIFK